MKTNNKTQGCVKSFRISQLTKETLICGITKFNDKMWYCDDCLEVSNGN